MAETETGFKWWMRYVIVPIIGGGGIIAVVIAIMQQPTSPKPPPDKAAEPSVVLQQATPILANKPSADTLHFEISQPTPPSTKSALPKPKQIRFYALGAHGIQYPGNRITLHRDASVIALVWSVDPSAIKGDLHMRYEDENRKTVADTLVNLTGNRPVAISSFVRFVLVDVSPSGEHVLADLYTYYE